MLHTDGLEFDTAEDDQLDLFYLVDCVLDEIELAKQQAAARLEPTTSPAAESAAGSPSGDQAEVDCQIMPEATEDFYTPDLMDQFDSVPPVYSDSEQSYTSPDTSSYISNTSFQNGGESFTSLPPELTAELLQNDIERECLSYASRSDVSHEIPMTSPHDFSSIEQYSVPHEERFSRNSYDAPSVPQFYGFEQSVDNSAGSTCNVQKETISKEVDLSMDRNMSTFVKDLPKEFVDLQQYSDLIQTPDLQHRAPCSVPTSTSPAESVAASTSAQSIHPFYSEDSNDTTVSEFVSWTCKHPENWSTNEVLDWLYYSAERNGVDCSLLRGESFRTITGANLCEMGQEEFCRLEPNYGQFLYKLFRQLVNGLRFTLPQETQLSFQEQTEDTYYAEQQAAQAYFDASRSSHDHSSQSQLTAKPLYPDHSQLQSSQLQQRTYDYGASHVSMSCPNNIDSMLIRPYDYSTDHHQYDQVYEYPVSACVMTSRDQDRSHAQSRVQQIRAKYQTDGVTPRRRPGRPRIKSLPTEEELAAQREKKLKSQHLWEFIYELLHNPNYNPSVLKWENQSDGVFRFVQSENVALLWGTLKSNENMTYEKLSRAMRHYYKRGILERVEGRRLVYKFSQGTLIKMKEKLAARRELER